MRKLVILIALVLCLPISAGRIDKKLPNPTNMVRYGCVVNGPVWKTDYNDPVGRQREVWVLTVWAAHQDPLAKKPTKDWELWYSDRRKRVKALIDCDQWMERVAKKVKVYRAASK